MTTNEGRGTARGPGRRQRPPRIWEPHVPSTGEDEDDGLRRNMDLSPNPPSHRLGPVRNSTFTKDGEGPPRHGPSSSLLRRPRGKGQKRKGRETVDGLSPTRPSGNGTRGLTCVSRHVPHSQVVFALTPSPLSAQTFTKNESQLP